MFGQLIPNGGGVPVSLLKRHLIVGREPTCDVAIPAQGISRKHCELKFVDGAWWVRDLDSRNGVGVNGTRVTEKRLEPGDTLTLGRSRFRIRYKAATKTMRSCPEEDIAISLLMDGAEKPGDSPPPQEEKRRPLQGPAPGMADVRVSRSVDRAPSTAAKPVTAPGSTATPGSTELKPGSPGWQTKRRYLGSLVPCGGGDAIALLKTTLLVGRRSKCDVTIRSKMVSSRHCTLTYEDGYWFVEDLSSHNGVRVNGERVDRRHLDPGDRIPFANQRYTIQYAPEGEPPVDNTIFSRSLLEKAGLAQIEHTEKPPQWLTKHEDHDGPKKYVIDDTDLEGLEN